MNTLDFLSHLRDQGIKVWAEDDRLRYRAPLGALRPGLREELLRRKTEILAFLHTATAGAQQIGPASREDPLPLHSAQERQWFLHQLAPNSTAYNLPSAIRLSGPLDVTALERGINEIVRRHESLRTSFPIENGRPVQVIAPSQQLAIPVVDLRDLDHAEREAEVWRLAKEDARQPFDLARGPLLRAALLWLGKEEHILLLSMHHIVSDGWSDKVLFYEMSVLYRAFSSGESSPLPELPIQYADYAVWQREWLQEEILQYHLDYWRQKLEGTLPVLELPADYPRPAVQSYAGAREFLVLDKHLTHAIRALSSQEGATLFMTLLAAFNVLLYRYTGLQDIIVGSPTAGRDTVEVEGLIGFFLNTLILRTDLSEDPSFRRLLRQVRETVLAAFAHQVVPFEELLRELQLGRSPSHAPLFQVLFILQDSSAPRLEFPGITASTLEVEHGTAQFDLSLSVTDTEKGLRAELEYNTDLFDAATAARMCGHLQVLLESIVADPEQAISQLSMLTEAEKHQLLLAWNRTDVEFPTHLCFHDLMEEQVARAPERVAVTCEGEELTYGQLNERATGLAQVLAQRGVGPEVVVSVLDERGINLLLGLIGILKAGGAYLPLDPRHPPARHRQILAQSGAALILAGARFVPTLGEALESMPVEERPQILELEQIVARAEGEAHLPHRCTPADVAYVIYTSGSTGKPKGAMVEHRGMVNHLHAKIVDLELTETDVVAQNASQTFDISIWQFLAALLVGGRVCILPDEVAHEPRRLLEQVEGEGVSILETVPSVLRLMLDEIVERSGSQLNLSALRWLIPTGEALPPELARQWLSHCPNIPLLNAYGPTECSDNVTHCPIYDPPAADIVNMPIGRPVANMRMYILDTHLQPVPIGVPGELYVGGVGVGRGYLNDPERTSELFLVDPFSPEPGARLYRTGDLVRYLPNGYIQFLGRLDYQVKIRGFRIELGEIEALLGKHPKVREVVLLVKETSGGDERLVAYVVPAGGTTPVPGVLRTYLQEKLPDYMVPASFIMLEALPLTPNGKVDRQALPEPDWSSYEPAQGYVAPRTPVEEVMADIWTQVLEIDRVGIHDNFFGLGGHSLLATQVISRARKALRIEVPLRAIFETPTVAGLAQAIIAQEPTPGQTQKTAQILRRLESLPAEEVRKLLRERESER